MNCCCEDEHSACLCPGVPRFQQIVILPLPFTLGCFPLPLPFTPKAFFSLTFGLSFPVALVHSVDLHGVIEGSMVLSWVPLSGHVVLNERIPDTCIRGFRTRMELHFGSQRGCQRFHQNADLSVDSKGFFRGSRIFDTKVPNLEFFTVRRANRGLSLCSGVRGSCCQLLARIASKVFAMLRIRIGRQCSGRCAVLRQTWRWPA